MEPIHARTVLFLFAAVGELDSELGVADVQWKTFESKLAISAADSWGLSIQVERECLMLIWGKLGYEGVDVESELCWKEEDGHRMLLVIVDSYDELGLVGGLVITR